MGREYPTKDGVCCLCDDGVVATGYCIEDGEHIAYQSHVSVCTKVLCQYQSKKFYRRWIKWVRKTKYQKEGKHLKTQVDFSWLNFYCGRKLMGLSRTRGSRQVGSVKNSSVSTQRNQEKKSS